MKVYITIDVEEDSWGDFSPDANAVTNIEQLPVVQELCDQYGAIPTYLVNWPVVSTKSSQSVLKKLVDTGRCEIGTHIHSWNTPPFSDDDQDKGGVMYLLPEDVIYQKLKRLHEKIISSLKVTPISFRAGRNVFDSKVARCIERLGYKIDTSVTPFINWSSWGGVDYTSAPTTMYRFDPANIFEEKKDGCLLQVPATIGFCQKNMQKAFAIRQWLLNSWLSHLRIIGILDRLNLLNFYILSPEHSNGAEMICLSKAYQKLGYEFLNLNFHSNSLIPGDSPYAHNAKAVEELLIKLRAFLEFALDAGFEFAPLSAALDG